MLPATRMCCRCRRAGATTTPSFRRPTSPRVRCVASRPSTWRCSVPAPDAGTGRLLAARLLTTEAEAEHVAGWIAHHWLDARGRPTGVSAAVLCRKRSQFGAVIDALERAGLPVEVVGLGGLLTTPEVSDIVALLWVVQDPTRGDQLMRLLTGPLCRLGAADLDGLAVWSRVLQPPRTGSIPSHGSAAGQGPGFDSADRPQHRGSPRRAAVSGLGRPQRLAHLGGGAPASDGLREAIRRLRSLTGHAPG